MEELVKENEYLQELAERYYKEVAELQEMSNQHEAEIDTLLKFNEKLLTIIEKELNGQKLKNSDILSLQPISEKTETESEMFQSQFTNVGNKLLMKKSLNLKPDPRERAPRPEPLAIVEREEQFSIDVEGNEKEEEGDHEIRSLIKEFRKKAKVTSGEFSLAEIERKYKEEAEALSKAKADSSEGCNALLRRLNDFKLSIREEKGKEKLIQMLGNIEASETTRMLIRGYISSLP